MASRQKQAGFSVLEPLLVAVVVCLPGRIGYFVYQSRHVDKHVSSTTADISQSSVTKTALVTTFAECKQAAGSKVLETYPEQCVAKAGKTFTDSNASSSDPP